jgi:hypothetical protein
VYDRRTVLSDYVGWCGLGRVQSQHYRGAMLIYSKI